MIIKDSMVLIHLAKLSLLKKACDYFKKVLIPEKVHKEILNGKEKKFPDVPIILELIQEKKIKIKGIKNRSLIKKAHQFNIQGGEAEAVALYWQEKSDFLATDDDNIRKKKVILDIKVIGTPAIMLKLYNQKIINKPKLKQSILELKKIGWFSNIVIDKMLLEVKNE